MRLPSASRAPTARFLQKIDTTLMSTEDQSILPDRPLVIDQLYTANPDLAGHPDGKLPGEPKPDCSKGSDASSPGATE